MKVKTFILLSFLGFIIIACKTKQEIKQKEKHLFILSGQSNMLNLIPEESFTPTLETTFGKGNVIVVKDAKGTMPIRRWYKDWKPLLGDEPKAQPDLYDSLMNKVYDVIENEKFISVTFIWMQGERDSRLGFGEIYEQSLIGLYYQLSNDLKRKDVNFVIGRLSDFGISRKEHPHWDMIRDIQVKVGESNPRFGWINTDDLNTGLSREGEELKDDIHMSADGYITMGKRFAEKAIEIIKNNK